MGAREKTKQNRNTVTLRTLLKTDCLWEGSDNKGNLLIGRIACRAQDYSLERGITEESMLQDPGTRHYAGLRVRLNVNKREYQPPLPTDKLTKTK